MKKFRKNTIRIITQSLFVCLLVGVSAYIACVYNTVLTASKTESLKAEFQTLQVSVSQKEHEYIQSVSSITLAYAEQLGYVRVSEDRIAYIDLKEETSLAVR